MKTNQEKWNEIVQRIEKLGKELGELVEDKLLDCSLLYLRMAIDELKEQEIND